MKTNRKTRPSECIAVKREAQARIYEEIRDLSPAQESAYFEASADSGPLREWWQAVKRARAEKPTSRAA